LSSSSYFSFVTKPPLPSLLQCKYCYRGAPGCATGNCELAATTTLSDEEQLATSLNALGSIRGAASSDNKFVYE
jgi:hypothetical protein